MGVIFTNNAVSRLAAGALNTDLTINLTPGEGALFPTITGSDWFPVTVTKTNGDQEIMRCTARATDVLTVTRGQEATTARTFLAGDRVELRLTAAAMTDITTTATAAAAALAVTVAALLPPGAGPLPWSRTTEPTGWIFADGRTLSGASPYTALRAAYIADSFPHGQDGSGNPKVPDMRGVVPAGADNMGGTAAGRLTGATAIGTLLGAETHTLTTAQLASHTHANTLAAGGSHNHTGASAAAGAHNHTITVASGGAHTHTFSGGFGPSGSGTAPSGDAGNSSASGVTDSDGAHIHTATNAAAVDHTHVISTQADHSHTITNVAAGTGDPHPNVQPTRVMNYIIKT